MKGGVPGYLRGLGERITDEIHDASEGVSMISAALRFLDDHPPPLDAEQADALSDLRQGLARAHSALHRLHELVR